MGFRYRGGFKMTENMTTMWVKEKDRDYLERLRRKMRKGALWSVLESMIRTIKEHKFEEELR